MKVKRYSNVEAAVLALKQKKEIKEEEGKEDWRLLTINSSLFLHIFKFFNAPFRKCKLFTQYFYRFCLFQTLILSFDLALLTKDKWIFWLRVRMLIETLSANRVSTHESQRINEVLKTAETTECCLNRLYRLVHLTYYCEHGFLHEF